MISDKAADPLNNDLFDRLGFLADVLLPRLPSAAVLALGCTCWSWRRAVQHCQTSMAPKSELAMPFVAGCCRLKHLQLSRMRPSPGKECPAAAAIVGSIHSPCSCCQDLPLTHTTCPFVSPHACMSTSTCTDCLPPQAPRLLAHVSQLTQLTHLDLSQDLTAAWMGQAVQVAAEDLAHLTGCSALQVGGTACRWLTAHTTPAKGLRKQACTHLVFRHICILCTSLKTHCIVW